MLLTKITAAQSEVVLSYHSMRGLYFMAVVFAATIVFTTTGDACLDQSLIYSYTMQYIIINSRQWTIHFNYRFLVLLQYLEAKCLCHSKFVYPLKISLGMKIDTKHFMLEYVSVR